MFKRIAALSLAVVAGALVACGGRGSNGNVMPAAGDMVTLPSIGSDLAVTAVMPPHSIGETLPSTLGTINMKGWHTVVGGFTQTKYSQTLAFPPGTKITIHNLSKTDEHTLDVVKQVSGPPANFPASPKLSVAAHGGGELGVGYASGPIGPGKAVTVTLSKAGTYLIGCAFHYSFGMRDIIVVSTKGKPGPQATEPPAATPTPQPTGTGGGGGWDGGWSRTAP